MVFCEKHSTRFYSYINLTVSTHLKVNYFNPLNTNQLCNERETGLVTMYSTGEPLSSDHDRKASLRIIEESKIRRAS